MLDVVALDPIVLAIPYTFLPVALTFCSVISEDVILTVIFLVILDMSATEPVISIAVKFTEINVKLLEIDPASK